jgi:hypothetical protein
LRAFYCEARQSGVLVIILQLCGYWESEFEAVGFGGYAQLELPGGMSVSEQSTI